MEALAAIGLVSNVLNFIEVTAKLSSLIKEYSSVGEAPAEILAVTKRLNLTVKVVKELDESGRARLDHEEHALQMYCREAESLRVFLESLKLCPEQPRGRSENGSRLSWLKNRRVEKGWKVFKALRGKEKIDRFESSLDRVLDLIKLQQQTRIEATALRVDDKTSILVQNSESIIRGLGDLQLIPNQEPADTATMQTKVIFMVPLARNSGFLGRDDIIRQLDEKFVTTEGHSQPREVQTTALCGLGGIGKSQIALEYAYLRKERSPDAIFWILASTTTRFEESYKQIAAEFQLPGRNDPHVDVLQLVRNWLEREYKQPWMMVVDNVDDNEVFEKMTSGKSPFEYLPKIANAIILFTSRNRDICLNLVNDPIIVEPLSRDFARKLLGDRTKGDSTDEEKDILLAELDHLPLAITQAASYMAKRNKSVPQYLLLFQDSERSRVKLLEHKFVDTGREARSLESIATTWLMSFEQIKSENPRAANLLFTMSLMSRQSIPTSLIKDENENLVDFEEAVGTLVAYSFVSADDSGSNYTMHRLVQTVTRAWLNDHGDRISIESQLLSSLSRRFPEGDFETWKTCARYRPHVESILSYIPESSVEAERLSRADLLSKLAWYFREQGKYDHARINIEQALNMMHSFEGCGSEKMFRAKRKLARIIGDQGYPEEAIKLLVALLGAEDALNVPNRLETLETVDMLAMALANTLFPTRWPESEKLARRSLEHRRSALNDGHPRLLKSLHTLGWVLYRQERFDESVCLLEECLQKLRASLGEKNPETISTANDLALGLINLNPPKFETAEQLLRESVKQIVLSCGTDHPNTIVVQSNLCKVLRRSGKHTEAEALQLEQLALSEKILGPNHPTTIWCLGLVAVSLFYQEEYDSTESFILTALEKRPDLIRRDIINALSLINILALVQEKHQDFIEAAKNFQTVLQGRKEELGVDHPATLQAEHCFARTILAQGKFSEAAVMLQVLMPREAQVLGEEHDQTLLTVRLYGLALFSQRKFTEAEPLFRQVLSTREKTLGKEHERTLITRDNLEAALGEQRKWTEWEETSRESLAIRERVAPGEYGTLRVKSNLWFTLEQQAKFDESETVFNGLLADIKALPADFMESESFKKNTTCEEEWYFWRLRDGSFDIETLKARKRMADWIRMDPSAAQQSRGTGMTGGGIASSISNFLKKEPQESPGDIYREVMRNMERTCGRESEEFKALKLDYERLFGQQHL
ncbi:hypothetical protein ONS95_004532 [Cadophora gregata]|uniref:uncharacterized protein n=1 Tax=Cadophora gregata TaxID=51156 RepID=UPI0026DB56D0|nr:uncharacterized protein ONS95_004532 [Cadophora gregata]KAK0105105.1 hypothetical protein ONS96_004508 [Cadophora gregata f. sp. sojae]KAK0106026.1 hypothetical protein ONS95_004532 [Cadophora gregata]